MYTYSRNKIEQVLLNLRKRVLSILYVCKMETTHEGMTLHLNAINNDKYHCVRKTFLNEDDLSA